MVFVSAGFPVWSGIRMNTVHLFVTTQMFVPEKRETSQILDPSFEALMFDIVC